MKYFYINLFFIFILVLIFSQTDSFNVLSSLKPVQTVIPTSTPTPTPTQAPPVRLIVPKLSIDTSIEPVSVGINNVMEVPDGWDKAGWYVRAAKPGETGTTVIVGHYDNQFGGPAIFFYLKQLEAGDKINILKADGQALTYKVTQKQNYPNWSSIDDLLVHDGSKNLILITCGGWWNQELQNYSERLVVRAISEN